MADVANRMGIAPGTLYLYVKSKEALFDLAIRYTLHKGRGEELPTPQELPLMEPDFDSTLEQLKAQFQHDQQTMAIYTVDMETQPRDARSEFMTLIGEVYDQMEQWRLGIRLLNSSVLDHPELAQVWMTQGRQPLYAQVSRYLMIRSRQGLVRPMLEPKAAAVMLLDTCSSFAIYPQRHRSRLDYDPKHGRATVLDLLAHAFIRAEHIKHR